MKTVLALHRLISLLVALLQDAIRFLVLGTHSKVALKAENIFLRKQLALYREREAKPRRASDATRLCMVLVSRPFAWQNALVSVKPETFLAWHRKGFRLLWRWKSRPRGRPRLPEQIQALIRKIAQENPLWGEERIAAELLLKSDETREFLVGMGERAHSKHQFRAGDTVSGEAVPVADPRLETVEFYKVSRLKTMRGRIEEQAQPPPWSGVPPPLAVYRERGHRRLASRTYEERCTTCLWGCRMAVEMIVDQWNPSRRRYRTETFCYGPRSCPLYRSDHSARFRAVME